MEKYQKDRKLAKLLLIVAAAVFIIIGIINPGATKSDGVTTLLSFVFLIAVIASIVFFIKSVSDKKHLSAEEKAQLIYKKEAKKALKEDEKRADEEAKKLAAQKVEEERKKRDFNIEEKAELLAKEQLAKEDMEEVKRMEAERKQEAIAFSREEIKCPRCGSHQISVNQKGYGIAKGAIGTVLLGPVGLVAGGIGKNKIKITCLNCGHSWIAGSHKN